MGNQDEHYASALIHAARMKCNGCAVASISICAIIKKKTERRKKRTKDERRKKRYWKEKEDKIEIPQEIIDSVADSDKDSDGV